MLQRRVSQAKGQPKNPLTDPQLEAKFRDCAALVLPAPRIDPLVTILKALETVPDVSERGETSTSSRWSQLNSQS